jgi:hypothetical protein
MDDTYWQVWVRRPGECWSVYHSDIPLSSIQFDGAPFVKLVKLVNQNNGGFKEYNYTRYIVLFQRAWREFHRMRKRWFRHLRMRELGISYPLR